MKHSGKVFVYIHPLYTYKENKAEIAVLQQGDDHNKIQNREVIQDFIVLV